MSSIAGSKIRWIRAGIVLMVLAGLLELVACFLLPVARPQIPFLKDRVIVHFGVLAPMSESRYGGFYEFNVLTWEEPFDHVRGTASIQLTGRGYKRTYSDAHCDVWANRSGGEVTLQTGRSITNKRPFDTSDDAGWVTAIVCRRADENWLTHVRLGLTQSP